MANTPDRALLSGLVDDYDRIAEESLGMGDPEFHAIEDRLFDAIDDSGYRAVIKNGNDLPARPEWASRGEHPRRASRGRGSGRPHMS